MKEDEFYGQCIQRIKFNENQAQRALRVLAFIYAARRPMTVEEILHAVAVRPDIVSMDQLVSFVPDEEDLVDDCEGLVIILPETRTLAFPHPTVKEYLDMAQQTLFNPCPEALIATTCLQYLCLDMFVEVQQGIEDLGKYAASHWNHHCHRAKLSGHLVDGMLDRFVNRHGEKEIVIVVLGSTGAGKTSFIKSVTGADLEIGHSLLSSKSLNYTITSFITLLISTATKDILAVPYKIGHQDVTLVDTPGFDDSHLTESDISYSIIRWMKNTYHNRYVLSGVISIGRITDFRLHFPSRPLHKVADLSNVIFATNAWEEIPQALAERREEERISYVDYMITNGSVVARILNDTEDTKRLVKLLLARILRRVPVSTQSP